MRTRLGRRVGALCVGLLLLGGCLGPAASPPIQLYLLGPIEAELPARPEGVPIVGIVPTRLPPYLARDAIVTRGEGNEVRISELHQWAEPLDVNMVRVIALNLGTLLPDVRLALFPWRGGPPLAAELRVTVLRFDGSLGGEVRLDALVRVLASRQTALLLERPIQLTEPAQGDDHAALVAAMNRALERLSREIAADIQKLDLRGSRG